MYRQLSCDLFRRGYDDSAIGFSYVPEFANDEEKKAYWQGFDMGWQHKKKVKAGEATWAEMSVLFDKAFEAMLGPVEVAA